METKWLNNKIPIWKNAVKPCWLTGICPFGQLVEEFPLEQEKSERSCQVFGHDCPIFYHAEPFAEENITDKQIATQSKKFLAELKKAYKRK